jgi:tRNA pseudouridine65 synthase
VRISVLHRDDALIVVDKPSGLAVHRGWARDDEVLMTLVRDDLGARVWPVHRLDRGASGALALALSADAARSASAAFAEGRVHKRYLALVRGVPPDEGIIDHPIPNGEERTAARVPATTWFRRLERFGRYSLVEAEPRTGRLHQIRRHLKHIACPLIGDVNYGKGEHNRHFRERYGLARLFLHASELELPHPWEAGLVRAFAPLPDELARVLERLRAHPDPGPTRA